MGVDLGGFVKDSIDKIGERGDVLQQKMDAILNSENVNPEDLLVVNYELGQYNSMLEVTSSINKSCTDVLKSLSQRTG